MDVHSDLSGMKRALHVVERAQIACSVLPHFEELQIVQAREKPVMERARLNGV